MVSVPYRGIFKFDLINEPYPEKRMVWIPVKITEY